MGHYVVKTLLKSLMYVEYTAFMAEFPGQALGQRFPNTDLTERVIKRSQIVGSESTIITKRITWPLTIMVDINLAKISGSKNNCGDFTNS